MGWKRRANRLTVEEMVALNNERRKQLNGENLKYYEDMLVYLRLSRIPQRRAEELLLEMLDHLLQAQREGRTARDVFGDDPESYCREVVAAIEKQPLYSFPRFLFIFMTMLYVVFIIDGLFRLAVYPLLGRLVDLPEPAGFKVDLLIIALLGPLLVEGIVAFLRLSTFEDNRLQFVLVFLFELLIFGVFLVWNFIWKDYMPVWPISAWTSLLIGVMLWLVHCGLFKGIFKHVDIF